MSATTDSFRTQPVDSTGGVHEVVLKGKVYADAAPRLRDALDRMAEQGLRALLVNAEALELIDSSGINVFVHLLKKIRPAGGRIVFFGLNKNVRRLFDIVKLDRVVGVEETRADALRSVQP